MQILIPLAILALMGWAVFGPEIIVTMRERHRFHQQRRAWRLSATRRK